MPTKPFKIKREGENKFHLSVHSLDSEKHNGHHLQANLTGSESTRGNQDQNERPQIRIKVPVKSQTPQATNYGNNKQHLK